MRVVHTCLCGVCTMDKASESYAQKILAELKVIAANIVGIVHAKPNEHSAPHLDSASRHRSEAQANAMRKTMTAKAEPSPSEKLDSVFPEKKNYEWLRKHKPF